jgi:hypothetical protein
MGAVVMVGSVAGVSLTKETEVCDSIVILGRKSVDDNVLRDEKSCNCVQQNYGTPFLILCIFCHQTIHADVT